jgi:hypothetical protein
MIDESARIVHGAAGCGFSSWLARDVSNACRFASLPEAIQRENPNRLPFDPVKPAGLKAYPSIWLRHMRDEDFRKGAGAYAPWEWLFGERRSDGCPVFGPSVTLPYAVLSGLI